MRRTLSVAALLLLLLTGCWGYRDIDELALVMAVGIDRTEEGRTRVTVQTARPFATPQGAEAGGVAPVYVATAEGRSVFEAIRNLALFTSRRIMWAHNKIIVIGRRQAEHGVEEIIDFFTRNPELRLRSLVAMADGEAQEIIALRTGMEPIPADSIEKVFRYALIIGETQSIDVKEFASSYLTEGMTHILPVLRSRTHALGVGKGEAEPREAVAQGLATFRDGRLAAVLNQQESRGVSLLRGRAGRIIFTLPCDSNPHEVLTLEMLNNRVSIQPSLTGPEQIAFAIGLKAEAGITSVGCPLNYRDPQVMAQLQEQLSEQLRNDMGAALSQAQESQTDPFGLGQHVRVRLPDAWERLRATWPDQMTQARFQVQTESRIIGSELAIQPGHLERRKRKGE